MAAKPVGDQTLQFTLAAIIVGLLVAGLAVSSGVGTRSPEEVALDDEAPATDRDEAPPAPAAVERGADAAASAVPSAPGEDPAVGPAPDAEPEREPGTPPRTEARARPGPEPGEEEPARTAGAPTELRATDRGVTADSVLVAIMLIDLARARSLGLALAPSVDPEEQRLRWDAWIGDINDRGGIHGRMVEPRYYTYDGLDDNEQRSVCLRATQDDGVFVALDAAAMNASAVLCFTQENETPFLALGSQGFTDRVFARSGGRLFTVQPEGGRTMRNFGWELHELGELQHEDALGQRQRKVLGILNTDYPGVRETMERSIVGPLTQLGYEIGHWEELSYDLGTASTQIPLAVNQMRSNGVEAVLLMTDPLRAPQFVQQAAAQRYFPDYYVSDWESGSVDTMVRNMPESFNGLLITTRRTGEWRVERPMPPFDAECDRIYRERTGQALERDDDAYGMSMFGCTLARMFELGASAAGPELTRAGLSQGLQSLGSVPLAHMGDGSLARGKFGAADQVRTSRYEAECRCWLPVSDFRAPRY